MPELFVAAAGLVILITGVGLVGVWRRRGAAEKMMAVQLLGTGGIAALLLLSVGQGDGAVLDVALFLALLAAVAAAAFRAVVLGARPAGAQPPAPPEAP